MIDVGQSPQHGASATEIHCLGCGVPESAGLGQHGLDCAVVYPVTTPEVPPS
jgi:hypothetical protein